MKQHFTVQKIIPFKELNDPNLIIDTSDYVFCTADSFVQLKFNKEDKEQRNKQIKPGLFKLAIKTAGLEFEPSDFTKDSFLSTYSKTQNIEENIDSFFNNFEVYKEIGIETPRRNILFYGPPGVGKSVTIHKVVNKYISDGKTCCIIWDTNVIEAYDVKSFLSKVTYENSGVEKVILIAEDIGGFENADYDIKSDSSLLSLLDNTNKTFILPTMIIATTNYPENLAENISNRSGRFDDKIKIDYPEPESRLNLLNFYVNSKFTLTQETIDLILSKECSKLTAAHIKEIYVRARIRNLDIAESIKQIIKEIELYNNNFSEQTKRQIGL